MFNGPIRANDIEVEIFTGGQYGDDIEACQLAINAWLKNQPNNIVVRDIIYRHAGRRSPRGKDIISMVIITSPAPKGG